MRSLYDAGAAMVSALVGARPGPLRQPPFEVSMRMSRCGNCGRSTQERETDRAVLDFCSIECAVRWLHREEPAQ